MYLYIDETIFEINGKKYYGVGALLTKSKIENNIIENALKNLSKDPDINIKENKKNDYETLNRQYFHAAEDSKNAHSHLCREISKSIDGNFYYTYYEADKDGNSNDEYYHRLNTMLTIIHGLNYGEKIEIFIEGRMGFSQYVADELQERLYHLIDLDAGIIPMMPAIYPELIVKVSDKKEAGLQVVDFILWAVNNKENDKKSVWIKYLKLNFSSSYREEDGEMSGGTYLLKDGIRNDKNRISFNLYPNGIFSRDEDNFSDSEILALYLQAEYTLHSLASMDLPNNVSYMQDRLKKISKLLLDNERISYDNLMEVATVYIRLFDTLPLYKNLDKVRDKDEFKKLLYTKKYLGLAMHKDKIQGVRLNDFFRDMRYKVIKENPNLFED